MIGYEKLQLLKSQVDEYETERELLSRDLRREQIRLRTEKRHCEDARRALIIIQLAAQKTQEVLQIHISKLVTSALYSVFPKPYDYIVKFVERRNTSECDIFFHRDGNYMEPEFASGGGPLDIASFSSRISQATLEGGRLLMVLDEPFKYVKTRSRIRNVCEMLIALKKELNIQFIIVTHNKNLRDAGDKVFRVVNGEIAEWDKWKDNEY